MDFSTYLDAKINVASSQLSLDSLLRKQQSERDSLQRRLAELDAVAKPFRIAATTTKEVFNDKKRRLLDLWQREHQYRWPSATIYTHGSTEWWARKAWLRMCGGHKTGPDWQWEADIDLFSPDGKFSRVFRNFGVSPDNRAVIIADFDKHLAVVTKMLEDSGYIIIPQGTEI